MKYRVHINSNTIKSNKKQGKSEPPITIRVGNKVLAYAHQVDIIGDSRVIYEPEHPLVCGAKVWIECDDVVWKSYPQEQGETSE